LPSLRAGREFQISKRAEDFPPRVGGCARAALKIGAAMNRNAVGNVRDQNLILRFALQKQMEHGEAVGTFSFFQNVEFQIGFGGVSEKFYACGAGWLLRTASRQANRQRNKDQGFETQHRGFYSGNLCSASLLILAMKTSLHWLRDFLPGELDPQKAADALINAGFPVENIESHGGDAVLDVEVTSNRGDCLSHLGVARELAVLFDLPLKELKINANESSSAVSDAVSVKIEATHLCPHYTARLIRGVKIGPSPDWLARRLEAVGIRPINNVVDVTNYVMFEMGQPLHAFDFAKIGGGKIIVRTAARGEILNSIDGKKRELTPDMLIIADEKRPVALAGVMGGLETEVSPTTVDVLLESARFDPLSVRRTARALTMKSDSSYRFERGIDPTLPLRASLRAAQLILETAGGELLKGVASAGSGESQPKLVSLRLSRLKQILGVEFPADQVMQAFTRLGFSPVHKGDKIDVIVPSYRLDISQEIDLVEEAARILGYERIPTVKEISIQVVPPQPQTITVETICQTLVASGFFEAVTFSFVSDGLKSDFGSSHLRADGAVRKADAHLRASLIPGLLEAVHFNETNGTAGAKLFEIGSTFSQAANISAGPKVDERRRVGCVGGKSLREIRGVVEAILHKLDAERVVKVVPDSRQGFAAGASGRVVWGDQTVGFLGKIDASVTGKLSLREHPTAAELELEPLLAGHRHVPQLKPLAKFPAVRRDISLVVAESLAFEKIQSLIQALQLPFLESLEFVTTYRGKPLESGSKSVTIALVFRSPTATLTSEQVEASVQKAVAAAKDQLGAAVRT
jgi:phenylalanyl-tRNA synthetase beta chain